MIARRQTLATITLISVILLAAHTASCNDVTWTSEKTHTAGKGDAFSVGAFTVEVTDFDGAGSVVLEIRLNTEEEAGEVVERIVLVKGDVWESDGSEIRLKCEDATDKNDLESIGRYPWYPAAKITSWVADRKTPDITLDISLDESEYLYGDTVTAEITAENDGDGDLRDALLNISLDGLYLADGGQLRRIGTISPDESRSVTVKLRFQAPPVDGNIHITLTGRGEDGAPYHRVGSRIVRLKPPPPPLGVRKFATPDIYWGETVYVSISAKNVQNYEVEQITLIDEVPDRFRLKDDLNLNWTFSLSPGEEKTFHYHLIPDRPGGFTLPAASASWRLQEMDYGAGSDCPATVVHGAFMDVVKTVKPDHAEIGEMVNVTIEVTNTGDLPAYIGLFDSLPANATYVSGRTNFTGFTFMRSQETERISYFMRIDSPDVNIPEPVVKFKETVYAGRSMNYTGNYEVTMPATLTIEVTAVTAISGSGDATPTDSASAGVNGDRGIPKPDSGRAAENETAMRRINVGAREVQQNIESLKTMVMPGPGGAWLVAAIMIAYVIAIRRIL
jgi:uncharacterized repeat protein (TIGR01451 family)